MGTQETLTALQFRIQQPETSPEQLLVDSDRVLIGSGAHCEIRLPQDQAAVEHVLVRFMGGFVYAEARAMNPPPLINGSPFTEAPLRPDSILKIGNSEITINVVEVADQGSVLQTKKEKSNPAIYVLAAIAVPVCVFILLDEGPSDGLGEKPNEIPTLWSDEEQPCPRQASGEALAAAREARLLAEGRRERSPFDVRDGVAAVPLFQQAAACYKNGGDEARSGEMEESATQLKARMDEEYRAHQMRLEHALEVEDLPAAQREVKQLLAMLTGQTGDYVVWLSNLERRLKLQIGEAEKK